MKDHFKEVVLPNSAGIRLMLARFEEEMERLRPLHRFLSHAHAKHEQGKMDQVELLELLTGYLIDVNIILDLSVSIKTVSIYQIRKHKRRKGRPRSELMVETLARRFPLKDS